jgi:hypothetical protein
MNDVQATDAEFWHVQLPSGEVRYWSLDELDEAFQRDEVDAKTFVLKVGDTSWQRLGELLGLDEEPAAAAPVIAPVMAPVQSFAPAAAPESFRGSDFASDFPGALSIRPVVSDLGDDDEDFAALKPKRKNVAFIGGGVAVALLLAIVGITHASSGSEPTAAAAAAAQPAPVVAPPPPAVDPVAVAPTLSDDVKRELLLADKAREVKSAAKAAENAKYHTAAKSTYRAPKSGQVFHKGGNKYDPLNSAL